MKCWGGNHYVHLNFMSKDHGEYKIGCTANGYFGGRFRLHVGETERCEAAQILKEYKDMGIPVYYSGATPCQQLKEMLEIPDKVTVTYL